MTTLSLGASGPAVLRLQLLLNTRAVAYLVPDSLFGVRTKAAVCQAQHNAGLPVTGVADPILLDALRQTPPAHIEVPRARTQLRPEEMRVALVAGHRMVFGREPSAHRLRIARAQMGCEHYPDGRAVYCFCLGNVMVGRDWAGPWFQMVAEERDRYGKPEWRCSRWRAYATPEEGGTGYWRMLAEHFPVALGRYDEGSPEDVARALKSEPGGAYFTASTGSYSRLLRAVFDSLPADP